MLDRRNAYSGLDSHTKTVQNLDDPLTPSQFSANRPLWLSKLPAVATHWPRT